MAKQATYIQKGDTIDYTNSGNAAIAYGDVIPATNCVLIAAENIAVGATGGADAVGVFELAAVNNAAFAVGDKLYWDATNKVLTKTSAGNTPAGICVATKAQTSATGKVKLQPM